LPDIPLIDDLLLRDHLVAQHAPRPGWREEFSLARAGDDDGAASWRRIMAAVEQLANRTPPGRVH
jgi:hypothetical protein